MALASVLLWIYSLIKPQGRFPHEHLLTVTVAGIFLGLHFACFFSAVKLTSIANATILGTIAPVFTVLIETVFLKRKLFKQVLFGVFFALAGALVINSGGFSILENSALGNALALLGSFFIALVFILAEKIRQKHPNCCLLQNPLFFRFLYSLCPLLCFGRCRVFLHTNRFWFVLRPCGHTHNNGSFCIKLCCSVYFPLLCYRRSAWRTYYCFVLCLGSLW